MLRTSSFSQANTLSTIVLASSLGLVSLLSLRHVLYPTLERRAKTFFLAILTKASLKVGPPGDSTADVWIHDDAIFIDWMHRGMLAIGETYMSGQWTVNTSTTSLDGVLTQLMALPSAAKRTLMKSWNATFVGAAARVFNYQSPARAGIVGAHHYDLGNDFFQHWLDTNMQYSCAYWKNASTLEEAQIAKLHLIATKLKLEPGMTVLEIGCGWGGLACFFATHYGVHVTGITISQEQLKGGRAWAAAQNVSHLTSFEYCDYREMQGQFDRVVSIAMLEAVGYQNLDIYYRVISRCLKPTGLSLVHSICANRSTKTAHQRWILKYIFPNGFLPSLSQMTSFSEKKGLVIEDCHNLGPDYDNTLMAWNVGFQQGLTDGVYEKPPVFCRMWEFYLAYCAAGFRARTIQLNQVVYSKQRSGRYDATR